MINLAKTGSRRVVYENRYHQVWQVEADVGSRTKEYFITDYGKRAGLLIARNEEVLLVRQYRLLIDRLSWEVPGGKVDEGETPEAAAVRECLEETGIRGLAPKPLLTYQPGLDTLHNPTFLFYTREYVESHPEEVHAEEVHGHEWVPLRKALDMVASGQIVDSFSILALFSYNTWIVNTDVKQSANGSGRSS